MTPIEPQYEPLRELAGQYCDGLLSAEQIATLEAQLRDDPKMLEYFVLYTEMHARIAWNIRANVDNTIEPEAGQPRADETAAVDPVTPAFTSSFPPIILDLSATAMPSPGPFSPGGMLFSYGVSALVIAVGLLVGWVSRVPHQQEYVQQTTEATKALATDPQMVFVARVTGMEDCRWADATTETVERAFVAVGRRYALASGLLEITYHSGAKVILQGPVTYEVDSADGGFLARGRLTAHVASSAKVTQTPAAGDHRGSGDQPTEASVSSANTKPAHLFVVHTPTATVTDLGTEFGVEVDAQGQTETRVFQGQVEVVRLEKESPSSSGGQGTILNAGQSARCDLKKGIVVAVSPNSANHFVRTLRRKPIEIPPILERFTGTVLGSAFQQNPPGRYLVRDGAALYQQPPLEQGQQARGYIRTAVTDFSKRDFVFDATFQVHLENPDKALRPHGHYVFFGIGDGVPNTDFFDEVTRGLVLAFCADNGRAFVRLCHPEATIENTGGALAELAAPGTLPASGRYCFRMIKTGKTLRFAIDVDFNGRFQEDFTSSPIDFSIATTLLNSLNSRLLVGTGNCDTMTVRFQELSIAFPKTNGDKAENTKPQEEMLRENEPSRQSK